MVFQFVSKEVFINGRKRKYKMVDHPGGAGILVLRDDQILLVEQYRPAVDRKVLEIPAGMIDPGEEPLTCAKRELKEETGFTAQKWHSLGAIYPTPGYTSETIYLFSADGLTPGDQDLDDSEDLTLHWIPITQFGKMIDEGTIKDAKTVVAFFRHQRILESKQGGE